MDLQTKKVIAHYGEIVNCDTIADAKELLNIFSQFFTSLVETQPGQSIQSDAGMLTMRVLKQLALKTLTAKRIIDGIPYHTRKGVNINLIDYSSLIALVREVYEMVCIFEVVFVLPDDLEKKRILYNLFKMQGFSERQKYDALPKDNRERKEYEQLEIRRMAEDIRSTKFYNSLDHVNKQKLDNHIKTCNHKLVLGRDGSVGKVNYETAPSLFNVKEKCYKNIYSFISLHAHPSYISLLQMGFETPDKRECGYLVGTATTYLCLLLSFFIPDYCTISSCAMDIFNKLDITTKFVLGFQNHCFKSKPDWLTVELDKIIGEATNIK